MNSNTNYVAIGLLSLASCIAFTSLAADAAEGEGLVAASERGRWTFAVGPAWRSRVKMETSGTVYAPPTTPRQTITSGRDMEDPANWTDPQAVNNPRYPGYDTDPQKWGVSDSRAEIWGIHGADYHVDNSDTAAPIGLDIHGCYDFYQGKNWSVGLNLKFAGYWNMKSETRGPFYAGGTLTQYYTDWYRFDECGYTGDFASDVDADIGDVPTYAPDLTQMTDRYVDKGTRYVDTRFRGDLYQIGLGPKITWTPFAGWCDCMDWLDVYGGVDILCNIAYSRFDADGCSSSQTSCRIGFGGNVGLVGNITDWLGIYAQVGYEWIDKTDISAGDFKADIDYSSLVLAAGVQFRF